MTDDKFQNRYRIRSARATWHNYGGGTYFITICTKNREDYFGTIKDGIMNMSEIGHIITENLDNVGSHYPYASIPMFVVMPNHIHVIVFINDDKIPSSRKKMDSLDNNHLGIGDILQNGRDAARHVSTTVCLVNKTDGLKPINEKMRNIANQQGWLSVVVCGIKSAVTRFANKKQIEFAWQSRFYDHIIQDIYELNIISGYIENNVSKWESDCFNNNSDQIPL